MKTSILVSSFAALFLMFTIGQAPKKQFSEDNHVALVSNYTYTPSVIVLAAPAKKMPAAVTVKAVAKANVAVAEDLSYLKFDVTAYSVNDDAIAEMNSENLSDHVKFDVNEYAGEELTSFDKIEMPVNEYLNLKFDVTDYTLNSELADADAIELPVIEYAGLKFDVNQYTSNSELTDPDAIELPVNEYAGLKFDVTEYTSNSELTDPDAVEMPVNEFDYLKFEVNEFADNDQLTDFNTIELPVNEYNYLKFDVNKFASQDSLNSDNFGELPVM